MIAIASASAAGFGEHTATRNLRLSRRKVNVVGPMAASSTLVVDTSSDGLNAGRSNDCRNMSTTNSAAEGAKKTIHQGSESGLPLIRQSVQKPMSRFTCRGGFDDAFQVLGKL